MSAPFRYARILNGLSFLISRRSAISRRIRAMAGLSNPQSFGLDVVVEHARASSRERFCDAATYLGRPIAEQAAAAARATDLRRRRAGASCPGDQVLDGGGGDTGGEPLAVVP